MGRCQPRPVDAIVREKGELKLAEGSTLTGFNL